MTQPSGSVLAYAAPQSGVPGHTRNIISSPSASYDRWTAVYDVAAHTVYLPNGTRLEARSGLGNRLARSTLRKHGTAFPRSTSVAPYTDWQRRLFGRTGLLAHTYMLSPNGNSRKFQIAAQHQLLAHPLVVGRVCKIR